MNEFEELNLKEGLLRTIQHLGFESPTDIQRLSIPHVLQGKDVIGESATGSGKTLAFGCGIIEKAVPGRGLQALVLTPTRELCEQVKDEMRRLSGKSLKIIAVYGGVSIGPQMDALERSEVAVATPGRLLDHMERGTINLQNVRILVLDEVDRMLDMGFIEDVERIISAVPRDRQTLFFSATVSAEIRELSKRFTHDAELVSVSNQVDPSKLKQVYYNVQGNMKLSLLLHLLKTDRSGLAMVFCNTRKTVDFVVSNLKKNRIDAIAIHGGLTQNKRSRTMDMFSDAKAGVLVCTDVASRGLHIDNVSHIYNYEIPKDPKDYVHRIGRTARAGEEGIAVNLLSDFDHDNFGRVEREYDFNIELRKRPYVERIMAVKTEMPRDRRNFRRQRRY